MKISFLFCFFFLAACNNDWSYDSPQKWGNSEDYKFCKIGYNQSPIDIKEIFHSSDLRFDYKVSTVEKENKNFSVYVNFDGKNYTYRGNKKYLLRSLSFHHPSEHLLNGKKHSLEMHIAHKSDDEQWLVVAFFLEVGAENSQFRDLLNLFASRDENKKLDLGKMINQEDEVFFYEGSFTTPPCKEGVKWYVMKTPLQISKEQMNKLIKAAIFVPSNARPAQEFHPERY